MKKIISATLLLGWFVLAGSMGTQGEENMLIKSAAFSENQLIPQKYTCQGKDVSPPLSIEGIPSGAKTVALIVDDPDAPMQTWVHWVVFNIPARSTVEIPEGNVPGKQGSNDFGKVDYGGPCPPSGTHRYFFKAYALDQELPLKEGARKGDVEKAMQGHMLAKGELIGLYKKGK